MFRPLAVNIGLRYARARRSFISFVSVLALLGLALSVATLLFVQAVVTGFERELNERILGVVPHLTITAHLPLADHADVADAVRGAPGVVGASAVVEGAGLLASPSAVIGAGLVGVDPAEYGRVSRLFEFTEGEPLVAGAFRVALGARAAERLGVGVGDALSVVLPEATATPLGVFPRQKRLRVAALVDTGSQLDHHSAYLHRDDAAKLFRIGAAVHGFHARAADPLRVGETRRAVLRVLSAGSFRAHSWFETLGDLPTAIGVTRNMLFLLLSLLVAVAAFNLISSLVMVVTERQGDVAMLRTIGARTGLVVGAFVVLGTVIATVGIGLGVAGGFALGAVAEVGFPWLEQALDTPLMGEYLVDALPVRFTAADIVRVIATALALCLAATVFPAWRAARLRPAQVLAHA